MTSIKSKLQLVLSHLKQILLFQNLYLNIFLWIVTIWNMFWIINLIFIFGVAFVVSIFRLKPETIIANPVIAFIYSSLESTFNNPINPYFNIILCIIIFTHFLRVIFIKDPNVKHRFLQILKKVLLVIPILISLISINPIANNAILLFRAASLDYTASTFPLTRLNSISKCPDFLIFEDANLVGGSGGTVRYIGFIWQPTLFSTSDPYKNGLISPYDGSLGGEKNKEISFDLEKTNQELLKTYNPNKKQYKLLSEDYLLNYKRCIEY